MREKQAEAKLNVRFPLEVMQALRELARKHQRSLNGEIVWIMREYIERQAKA